MSLKRKCDETFPENKRRRETTDNILETTNNIYCNEENLILEKDTKKPFTGDKITIYTNSNNRYSGSVLKGLFSGQGTLTRTNGDTYNGEFENGKRNGRGTMIFANGCECNCNWINGKANGEGTFTSFNGNKYIGEFQGGKRNGKGTLTWGNLEKIRNKYEGEFINNNYVKGIMIYKDGSNYNGEFLEKKKHGFGIETFPLNRGFYKGYFKEDKKDGEGTLELTNGYKYTGSWRNGKREGKGEEFIPRLGYMINVTRKGNWNNDKPQGDFDVSGKTFFP